MKSTCSQVRSVNLTFRTTGSDISELPEAPPSRIEAARAYVMASAGELQKKL
jgi:hypothetical protein